MKTKIKIILKNNSIIEVELRGKYKTNTVMYWVNQNYPDAKEIVYSGRLIQVTEAKKPLHSIIKLENEK